MGKHKCRESLTSRHLLDTYLIKNKHYFYASMEQQQGEIISRYSNAIINSEQFTGTTTQRPIFNNVIENLNTGDTLVVCKLDRLARNTTEGIELVQGLFNKGVAVHVLNVVLY